MTIWPLMEYSETLQVSEAHCYQFGACTTGFNLFVTGCRYGDDTSYILIYKSGYYMYNLLVIASHKNSQIEVKILLGDGSHEE